MDERLTGQFKDITRTILENQNEALGNLTSKVSKEKNNVVKTIRLYKHLYC